MTTHALLGSAALEARRHDRDRARDDQGVAIVLSGESARLRRPSLDVRDRRCSLVLRVSPQSSSTLIVSEPSNPWVSGVSGLFTTEFYGRLKGYLTPNGIFAQWLHLYEIDDGLVLGVIVCAVAALSDVFDLPDLKSGHSHRREPQVARCRAPDWSIFQSSGVV